MIWIYAIKIINLPKISIKKVFPFSTLYDKIWLYQKKEGNTNEDNIKTKSIIALIVFVLFQILSINAIISFAGENISTQDIEEGVYIIKSSVNQEIVFLKVILKSKLWNLNIKC